MSRPLNYKIEAFEKILDRKYKTIKIYLDRPEFKHIQVVRSKKGKFFTDVTWEDIKALKRLFENRHNNKY